MIVTFNAGSSSLKFAVFSADGRQALLRGQVDAQAAALRLRWRAHDDAAASEALQLPAAADGRWTGSMSDVVRVIGSQVDRSRIAAVGHRIVHGGTRFARPVRIDAAVFAQLHELVPLAPLHQPENLALVRAAEQSFANVPQVACFDTAFHRTHDAVADAYALPPRWRAAGIRRYGFHGLSYQSAVEALRIVAPEIADGRVAIAHLGNGASLCAVRQGRSVDCTMGFSVLDGLPMGTRCGQIDPGVLLHLLQAHGLSIEELAELLYRDSGLRGLSGLSGDMRVLEAEAEKGHAGATLAIDYLVARLLREIGAAAAALGGLDALVFTGGIGEHSSLVRRRACAGLGWLGVELDAAANDVHAQCISVDRSPVSVFVLATDEEAQIAAACARLLNFAATDDR